MNETNKLLTANIEKPNYYAWIFMTIVLSSLVLWLFSIFYNGVYATQFDIFFKRCGDIFADFTNICGYASQRDPYNNTMHSLENHSYPPLPYIVAFIFSRVIVQPEKVYRFAYLQPQFLIMFVIMTAFVITLINSFVASQLQGSSTLKFLCALAITFCSPMIVLIERANIMLIVMLFCMIYCFWYDSESKIKREISLICLGAAFAIKITPCLFGILLLIDKRYKDAIKCALYGVVLLLLPFLFFNGGFANIPLLLRNMGVYLAKNEHWVGLSLKSIVYGVFGSETISERGVIAYNAQLIASKCFLNTAINVVRIVSAILFLATVPLYEKKWQRLLSISIVLVFAPKVAGLYNVVYLFPSLIMFLNEERRESCDVICLGAFALMCSVFFISYRINYQLPVFVLYIFTMFLALKSVFVFLTQKNTDSLELDTE